MSKYLLVVRDSNGRTLLRSCAAKDESEAIQKCKEQGLIFVKFYEE